MSRMSVLSLLNHVPSGECLFNDCYNDVSTVCVEFNSIEMLGPPKSKKSLCDCGNGIIEG